MLISTDYVVGLNIQLESQSDVSESDLQNIVDEVRLTTVSLIFDVMNSQYSFFFNV